MLFLRIYLGTNKLSEVSTKNEAGLKIQVAFPAATQEDSAQLATEFAARALRAEVAKRLKDAQFATDNTTLQTNQDAVETGMGTDWPEA